MDLRIIIAIFGIGVLIIEILIFFIISLKQDIKWLKEDQKRTEKEISDLKSKIFTIELNRGK